MASWDYFDTFFADPVYSAAPRPSYPDPQPAPLHPPPEPYLPDAYVQEPPRELPSPPQPQAPPSPRKSMFEFVSPFDALAANPIPVKKKPAPSSSPSEEPWAPASLASLNDPKRKSVENLIEQLTRGQAPYPAQPPSPSYDPYSTTEEYPQVEPTQQQQSRPMPPPPLPPKPTLVSSPRASPPKLPLQQPPRPQPRSAESPQPIAPVRRDKEGSPGPRPNWKNDARPKPVAKGKSHSSPRCVPSFPHSLHSIPCSPQPQSIVFDVAQPLDEIQAARDAVKSTAIALVKQDPVFLPGSTIGATHWIAYAMTRGRVRVISRSSGDRTLLQLPTVFAPVTQVIDMAVYGNRLAGVTSDGGFVVWELPEVITDDVPYVSMRSLALRLTFRLVVTFCCVSCRARMPILCTPSSGIPNKPTPWRLLLKQRCIYWIWRTLRVHSGANPSRKLGSTASLKSFLFHP